MKLGKYIRLPSAVILIKENLKWNILIKTSSRESVRTIYVLVPFARNVIHINSGLSLLCDKLNDELQTMFSCGI